MNINKIYYKEINSYRPRNITNIRGGKYVQDADNCWFYAALNCLYQNTKIITDVVDYKLYVKSKKINTQYSNSAHAGVIMTSKYRNDKGILAYGFSILENKQLFEKLLNHGYSIIYTRTSNTELLYDILQDDEVDKIRPKLGSNQGRHISTIKLQNGKLTEKGSWGNDNIFNEFTFDSIDLFYKCIEYGVIENKVFFLDYFQ